MSPIVLSAAGDGASSRVRTRFKKWVKVRAARMGKGDSEVIEDSLRRDLGLELLERLAATAWSAPMVAWVFTLFTSGLVTYALGRM